MHLTVIDAIAIAGILCLAGTVQSSIGFGYALVSTPLMIWIGVSLPDAITIAAISSFIQACIGARHLRASVPWRLTLIATALRLTMLIVGLLILKRIAGLDSDSIRMVVGILLCVLVVAQLLIKPRPIETMHWSWGALAFGASGILAGVCGMGGPPLVLWSLRHNWPVEKTRGFLFAVFAMSIPLQVVMLYAAFGKSILLSTATAAMLSPAVFIGAAIGLPLGNRLPRVVLARIVYAVLLLIGLSSIIPQIVQQLQ